MPRYRAKPLEIDAVELRTSVALTVGKGVQRGKPGDFLVTYPNGGQALLTAAQLAAGFEPVPNGGPMTADMTTGTAPMRTVPRHRAGSQVDATTLTKMQQQWQAGAKVEHIAKACGVSVSVVYHYSSKRKWKRGKATKGGAGLTVGSAAALPGRVRCPHCQEWTETDPCSQCKKRMAKW